MHRFSDADLEVIVLLAAKKLNKFEDLSNNKESRQLAVNYFKENITNQHTAQDLANTALLGVMNVYITGAVQPVVRYNWGDRTGAPDLSPYTGGSGGGSTLDEANNLSHLFGQDNLGTEARVIANYLRAGEFGPGFVEYLNQNGMNLEASPTSELKQQTLKPKT